MDKIELQAQERQETGRRVRNVSDKRIPGVIYGHAFETKNVWVDQTLFNRAFDKAGTSSIVTIQVGDEKPFGTLIHDFQAHPISNEIMHVDFFHVRMDEKVETHIPLVTVGESAAIKTLGGVLNHLETLTVKALPGDLVHEIAVDISAIETFDDRIMISDLGISENIDVMTDLDTPVATVSAPRIQQEEEVVEVADGEEASEGGESAEKTEEA